MTEADIKELSANVEAATDFLDGAGEVEWIDISIAAVKKELAASVYQFRLNRGLRRDAEMKTYATAVETCRAAIRYLEARRATLLEET
jgi:hypothetical protein